MKSGNAVAAKALWEEAEIMEDMQLFGLFLPHLTFFLGVAKRCGFMSEELKDLDELGGNELETLQHMAALFAGQAYCNLRDRKMGNSSAKVVAEALKSSATETLYLHDNEIGDQGAEALAESLKSNRNLKCLLLGWNNIGDRGAEALAESLKSNGSLEQLYLNSNKIADRGAEALASGLKQNRSLKTLHLSIPKSNLWGAWFNSGALGRQALEEAEKIKKERGDNFELVWE